jgi:hypothetical protein
MISVRVDLGRAVVWLTSAKRPPTPPNLNHPLGFLANDNLHQFEFCSAQGRFLPRQSGLCPRVSVGAQRRVRRGPSLGEATPAGAVNSRGALHALQSDRPTMTAFSCEGWKSTPALASLSPSQSNVLRFKVKCKNKSGKELQC